MTQQDGTSQRVNVAEAAELLGVSTTTIRRMVKRGQLEGERVIRPQGSAFLAWSPGAFRRVPDLCANSFATLLVGPAPDTATRRRFSH